MLVYLYIWICLQRHIGCEIVSSEKDDLQLLFVHNFLKV